MTAVLYVAARAPRAGFAKTRLGRAIGDVPATRLYAAFLGDLAARFAGAPFPVGWYVTPEDAWDELAPIVMTDTGPAVDGASLPCRVLLQGPGDWATRQQALFRDAPSRDETRTVLIASDSPHLEVAVVVEAFDLLERHDLVLGPTLDGGYYLIGMRGPWEILGGVTMSTSTVLADIVARAERLGLAVAFVPPTFDVDEADDLARLAEVVAERDDLPSTRAALAMVGSLTAAGSTAGSVNGHAAKPLIISWSVRDAAPSRVVRWHEDEGVAL